MTSMVFIWLSRMKTWLEEGGGGLAALEYSREALKAARSLPPLIA